MADKDPFAGFATPAPAEPASGGADAFAGYATPDTSAQEGVIPPQHPNSTPTLPMDQMPFGDQVSLAGLDNIKEYQRFLGHKYGEKAVTMDWSPDGQPQLIVQTPQGKYRVGGPSDDGPSFIAKLTADAPEIAGTIAGGTIGTFLGGPGAGTLLGAGIGGSVMHGVTEAQKASRGELDKTPTEELTSSALSAGNAMLGEGGGQLIGKGVSKALTFRLPKFITGATDESIAMTKEAMKAGAKPNYASMAPDAMHLRRIEAMGAKLAGTYVQQDKANMAFVRSELAKKLRGMGYPPDHIDEFLNTISGPEHSVSNTEVGDGFKASVEAYRNTLVKAVDDSAAAADTHIDAQLKAYNDKIDASKHGDLTGDFAAMIDSANQDFKNRANELYGRVDKLVGNARIVPTDQVAAEAKKIVDLIRQTSPSQVNRMTADLAKTSKASEAGAVTINTAAAKSASQTPLRQRILDAYMRITNNQTGARALLKDLRSQLSDVPRAQLDKELNQMSMDNVGMLMRLDNRLEMTAEDTSAAMRHGGEDKHLLWVSEQDYARGRSAAPSPGGALSQEDDAVLMQEFGIEIPKNGEKWSLQAAQRLRTVLRDKAYGNRVLQNNSTQHDYGQLADAVDRAIQEAALDPQAKAGVEAFNKADEFWKKNVRKFDDAKLDTIMKNIKGGAPPDPEALVKSLTNVSSNRIARLRGMVGDDVWKRIQGTHLDTFMRPFETDDFNGKKIIDGMAMIRKLRSGDVTKQMDAIHGEGTAHEMEEIAKMIATRQGKLDPAVLMNGGPKEALAKMNAEKARLDEYMKSNALRILANPDMTGEQAYQWIARGHENGGDDSRIQAVIAAFGPKSPQMAGVRQAALEEVARNASLHAINKGGNTALDKALQQYSPAQLKELFPEGMAEDMRHISDVIKFMFPFKSGINQSGDMPGMAAGAIQSHKMTRRLYETAVAGVMRFIVLHPSAVKWIVTGREEGEEAWMRGTAELFRKMTQVSTQIAENSAEDTQDRFEPGPAPPAARPGQPPMTMPGPQTVQ